MLHGSINTAPTCFMFLYTLLHHASFIYKHCFHMFYLPINTDQSSFTRTYFIPIWFNYVFVSIYTAHMCFIYLYTLLHHTEITFTFLYTLLRMLRLSIYTAPTYFSFVSIYTSHTCLIYLMHCSNKLQKHLEQYIWINVGRMSCVYKNESRHLLYLTSNVLKNYRHSELPFPDNFKII